MEGWEAGEVSVGGAEGEAVLDGEGGQVGVRDEIAVNSGQGEELAENLSVALGWLRNPGWLAGEPLPYLLPGVSHRFRAWESPRMGRHAQEAEQARPWQTDRRDAV